MIKLIEIHATLARLHEKQKSLLEERHILDKEYAETGLAILQYEQMQGYILWEFAKLR